MQGIYHQANRINAIRDDASRFSPACFPAGGAIPVARREVYLVTMIFISPLFNLCPVLPP
jgi:hypothetical protein